jgi:uncharacterized membrane protein YraQ (UPF0718 family)
MSEKKLGLLFLAVFLGLVFLPVDGPQVVGALGEALALTRWYAREHVLLCLVPALFIAGAIAVFVSQDSVMRYLGGGAKRWVAYAVASVSGSVLAVCSCTVLPLFAGIYKRGAGLGPATAFLYSGPAINVLAIILTARVLGVELGVARGVGAVLFSVLIGLAMAFLFRKEEAVRAQGFAQNPVVASGRRPAQEIAFFVAMMAFLIFANWGAPREGIAGWYAVVYEAKWYLAGASLLAVGLMTWRWFSGEERRGWLASVWDYTKLMLPLLLAGVLAAGFLLGRPGHDGLIPSNWVATLVGGNSLWSNFFASVVGAFMYFATLTEVPIVQGLVGSGMGKGPALALLLSGPALSLPSMLVIRQVLGMKKTVAFVLLVVGMSTIAGWLFGTLA